MKYIIGNWKSYKTVAEAKQWLTTISGNDAVKTRSEEKTVVICVPFTVLPLMQWFINEHQLTLELGAQNVSPFEEGAYTGEVSVKQVKELAHYTIIGHSERREHFGETDEMLATKVSLAKAAGLMVIFCVQGKDTPIPHGVDIVAYEPVFAIGSGTPDTPENAESVASALKEKGAAVVLYGGSVKPENIASFTRQASIAGALIGGASLDAASFLSLITNA